MIALPSSTTARRQALTALVVVLVLLFAALLGRNASARLLLLGVGAVGFLLLLRFPGLGLVALVAMTFTLPLEIGTGTEVALTPPVFVVPLIAAAWVLDGLRRRDLRLPAARPVLPLLLLLLAGLLSLLAGRVYWDPLVPQPGNLLLVQLAQWGIYVLSATVFIVTAGWGSRGRWLEAATWVFLALGAVVVLEFYVPPLNHLLGWSSPTMASSSMFWVWFGGLATGQLLFNRKLSPMLRLGLLIVLLAASYVVWFRLSDWVSGWVPFTVATLGVIWLWVWHRNRTLALLLALGLLVLGVVLYPILFVHVGGEQELEASWGGRLTLYKATLDLVKEHPVLGLGPAAYRQYGLVRRLSLGVGRAVYLQPLISSHNNYLDIYAQMGLVGLGLFVWFWIEMGLLGWRAVARRQEDRSSGFQRGYAHGALAGLVATSVSMLLADWLLPFVYNIGFPGFRTSVLAWMFLGGLVALEQVAKRTPRAVGDT
jgi:O-antigen ligase